MGVSELDGGELRGYELRNQIGAGAFGVVYRAYQQMIGREVAIKMILPRYANHPDFIRRFEVEAQVIARLEHPHIVPLYDYWRDPDGAYLTMRWLKGNLRDSRGAWKLTDVARLLDQVASAMAFAHREGIIHRDIHPRNILLDEDQNAYLADFGIAHNIFLRRTAGGLNDLPDLPEYWSPEQIRGELVTNRTDIYSLGCVVYEMVSGESIFPDATTSAEYIRNHLTTPLPMVSVGKRNIPAAVDEVLQTATAKEPSHRYPTALRFAAAFRAAIPAVLPSASRQPLVEPLTGRELEVLQLLIDDISTREIAERLVLTSETVRWYYRQIYRKLDVNSRQQAVERALSLKLNQPGSTASRVELVGEDITPEALETPMSGEAPENPYKGLRAFQESDARDFFGRAALTERLLSRLSEIGETSRLLVVVGPSGSGKSSAVRAGLIPALRKGALATSPSPFIAEFLPGAYPIEELEAALLRVSVSPLPDLFTQLSEDRRGLVRAIKRLLPPDAKTELFLFIDQFEELFTLVEDEAIRTHFIDLLLSAVTDPRSRVWVIATLRADFYDRPLMYPRLAELIRTNSEVVLPFTTREMEQAIVAPAERIGMRLETGLVATILDDVGEQPGTLPLLEYALTELFEHREGMMLTEDGYKAAGGVNDALAKRADHLFNGFDTREQELTRQLFLRLITLGEGVEDTRRRALLAELAELNEPGSAEEIINAYVEYRLLTLDHDPVTRGPSVEIAHEALIREWGRLREWLSESREDIRIQRRLAYMANEWLAADKDPSFLARGLQLSQFEGWTSNAGITLTLQEREYLNISLTQRQREQETEVERKAHELKLERRSRNFLRGLVAVLAIGLLAALLLTGAAVAERERAEANEQAANAERARAEENAQIAQANFQHSEALRLAAAANALLPGNINDHQTAALLAIRSLNLGYSSEADNALTQAVNSLHTVRYFPTTDGISSRASFSPDRTMFAVPTPSFDIQIWDAANWTLLHTLEGHTEEIIDLAWAPNSELLVTASWDGASRIWDAQSGSETGQIPGTNYRAHWSSDSRWIGTVSNPDWRPTLWDVTNGEAVDIPHIDDWPLVHDIAFSSDSSAMFINDWVINRMIDIQSGELLREFPCALYTLFSEDGSQMMCVNDVDQRVDFWDTATWAISQSMDTTTDLFAVAYSPDNSLAVLGSGVGHIVVVDVASGEVLQEWAAANAVIFSGAFLPDANQLITGSGDGNASIWDIRTGVELRRFTGFVDANVREVSADGTLALVNSYRGAHLVNTDVEHTPRSFSGVSIYRVSFSPDGTQILIGDEGISYLWDVDSEQIVRQFSVAGAEASGVGSAVFSPDGQMILTGSTQSGDVRLWDADSGALIRILPGPSAAWEVAFSPDGIHAAGSNEFGDIYLWDVNTGAVAQILPEHTGFAGVVFSPDGALLASADGAGVVRLWNTSSGELEQRIDSGHTLNAFNWSPDGRYLFMGGGSNFSQVWDIQTNAPVPAFPNLPNTTAAVFSVDGSQVFVGRTGGFIRMLDVESGTELRYFKPHNEWIVSLSISPDGKYIVSGAVDGSVYISPIEVSDLVEDACARLLWDFSPEERIQYGITDDEPTCPQEIAPVTRG